MGGDERAILNAPKPTEMASRQKERGRCHKSERPARSLGRAWLARTPPAATSVTAPALLIANKEAPHPSSQ